MTENEAGVPATGTPTNSTGEAGHTGKHYSISGPYVVKLALEGLPLGDVSNVEEPWRNWALYIVNGRNGRTAGEVWEDILARLPIIQRRAVQASVLSATADPEQWIDRLNEAFATAPYRRAAEKARRVFVEALHIEAPHIDVEKFLSPLTMIDSVDLLTKHHSDPIWAVPRLIPVGLTLLAGRPKVGKSWLSMQIALAVATGGLVLGQRVDIGRILYLALEDSERRLQQRMKAQGWQADAPGQVKFMLSEAFRDEIEHLNAGGGHRLIKHLEKEQYRLLVIDTFSRAFRGDQNDSGEMTAALDLLQSTMNRLEVACIIIDHHTKPKGADPNPIDDILGSSAKSAVADTLIGLYKEQGKAGAKLYVKGRDVEERTLQLKWDETLHCWQSEGDAADCEAAEQRQAIVEALQSMGASQVSEAADHLGVNKGYLHRQLQALVGAGVVLRFQQGRKVFYRLAGQPEPAAD